MRKHYQYSIAVMLLLLGQSCSSEKSRIERAIQNYLNANPPHCVSLRGTLESPTYRALGEVGVIKLNFQANTFEVTPLGAPYYRLEKSSMPGWGPQQTARFCVGKVKFGQVEEYTTPVSTPMGKRTNVVFNYTVTEVPSWTIHPEVKKAFDGFNTLPVAGKVLRSMQTLIETNNGWKVIGL